MAKKWSEVIASPEFRALKPEDQEAARSQYFAEVIAPQVPAASRADARAQFDAEFGPGGSMLPKATEPAPERSTLQEIGRQVGLTARHAIAGVAALPAMASDAVTGVYNTAADAVAGKGSGFRFKSAGQALQDTLTAAGLPAPEGKTERIVGDVTSAMSGAGASVGAGQVLSRAASPVISAVGSGLSEGVGAQIVSSATGAGASGLTRENGGGAAAQAAAGIAGAMAPTVGPTMLDAVRRGILRGGEAGRQKVAENLKVFQEAGGTTPTLGQATESRARLAIESALAKAPGSAGVISRFAQQQADDMQTAVQRLSDDLAPNASAVNAGEAIVRGVDAFKKGFKSTQSRLYDELGQVLPQDTPITVDRTRQALAAMNEGIEGAPALSAWFKNAKIQGIEKALVSDLDLAATPVGQSSVMPQAPRPAALPYEAIKKLRTLVGAEITDGSLVSDVPRSKWQALYGALTDDLGEAAKAAGPKAEQAWAAANDFTRQHMQRLDELSSIVKRDSPEKIFNAAISGTSEGATIIKRVMSALPSEEQREVAAAVLQRLGRATPGQQNAMGDAFSAETFLTNLAKLSPAARDTLFGANAKGIEQLGKLAELRREGGRVFANPSGTASGLAQMAVGSGVGAGMMMAAAGNPGPLLGAVAAPIGANLAARVVTSPRVLQLAASKTPIPPGMAAAAAGAAARLNTAADVPPDRRVVGQVYETPRGRFIWRGTGWEPSP